MIAGMAAWVLALVALAILCDRWSIWPILVLLIAAGVCA